MKQNNKFSVRKRVSSFYYAFNGLKILLQDEHNSWIHICAAVCAVLMGFFFELVAYEWIAICFAIGLVIVLEIINSSIENLADYVSPGKHELIRKVKDLSAAAVLIGAITALVVGIIIFLPKILLYAGAFKKI